MTGNYYKGKKIIVTGGAGSIGYNLVKALLKLEPESITVFDNNETGLYDLDQELQSDKIHILLGDIRDKDRLLMAFEDIDIVFHASALKHVPICEFNPFDAVKTNVLGTQNVLEAALLRNVEKVINVSTDKAVNPVNVMGATKFLGERLTISANYYSINKKTVFSSVRFGNVLNSRGSVIPLFNKQIMNGGPVTVTDKEMTRFFMEIPSAVNLIINAGKISQGKELFILKMPALNILDLAEVMINQLGSHYGYNKEELKVNIIGVREGEKLSEELMTVEESYRAYENNTMILILPYKYFSASEQQFNIPKGFEKCKIREFSSKNAKRITKDEIAKIIKKTFLKCNG